MRTWTTAIACAAVLLSPIALDAHVSDAIGPASVDDSSKLDPSKVDDALRRHLAMIQYCYEREVASRPGLAGEVTLSFSIGADGRTSLVTLKSSTLGDDAVERCIETGVSQILFPKPNGGATVHVDVPFSFHGAESAPGCEEPRFGCLSTVTFSGDIEAAQTAARTAIADAGEKIADDATASDWNVSTTSDPPPHRSRRYQLEAICVEEKQTCGLTLVSESNSQHDEGGGRWSWGEWERTAPASKEIEVFERARQLLLDRLPKPDPNAPPPGVQLLPSPPSAPGILDVKTIGITPIALSKPVLQAPTGVKGGVMVEIVVDESGNVVSAKVVKSQPALDAAALESVRKWRYQPVILNGIRRSWTSTVVVTFK